MSARDDFHQWCDEATDSQLTIVNHEALMRLIAEVDRLSPIDTSPA